jgi:hypothetical protein
MPLGNNRAGTRGLPEGRDILASILTPVIKSQGRGGSGGIPPTVPIFSASVGEGCNLSSWFQQTNKQPYFLKSRTPCFHSFK